MVGLITSNGQCDWWVPAVTAIWQQSYCNRSYIVIQVGKYLANNCRVFAKAPSGDAGESLPRERSECFGYDSDITTAFTTGLTKSRRY